MMRKIAAILAGFVLWTALWLGGNAAIRGLSPDVFDKNGLTAQAGWLVLILLLSVACSISAGRTSDAIAAKTATTLGLVLLLVGTIVQIAYWDQLPVWYHIAFLVMILPATTVGGRIRIAA